MTCFTLTCQRPEPGNLDVPDSAYWGLFIGVIAIIYYLVKAMFAGDGDPSEKTRRAESKVQMTAAGSAIAWGCCIVLIGIVSLF